MLVSEQNAPPQVTFSSFCTTQPELGGLPVRADGQIVYNLVVVERPQPVLIDPTAGKPREDTSPRDPSVRARELGFRGRMLPVAPREPLPPDWRCAKMETSDGSK